ncbi:MAG: hypothetical protein Q7T73_12475 [Beijerinckiaceae bacterium]|nr:hypothetical protein [Beijerinckiaceae bacterium]
MSRKLFISPFTIAYEGLDADQHFVDARQIGISLGETGRLYKSVSAFIWEGLLQTKGSHIRVAVGPPSPWVSDILQRTFTATVLRKQIV